MDGLCLFLAVCPAFLNSNLMFFKITKFKKAVLKLTHFRHLEGIFAIMNYTQSSVCLNTSMHQS